MKFRCCRKRRKHDNGNMQMSISLLLSFWAGECVSIYLSISILDIVPCVGRVIDDLIPGHVCFFQVCKLSSHSEFSLRLCWTVCCTTGLRGLRGRRQSGRVSSEDEKRVCSRETRSQLEHIFKSKALCSKWVEWVSKRATEWPIKTRVSLTRNATASWLFKDHRKVAVSCHRKMTPNIVFAMNAKLYLWVKGIVCFISIEIWVQSEICYWKIWTL